MLEVVRQHQFPSVTEAENAIRAAILQHGYGARKTDDIYPSSSSPALAWSHSCPKNRRLRMPATTKEP